MYYRLHSYNEISQRKKVKKIIKKKNTFIVFIEKNPCISVHTYVNTQWAHETEMHDYIYYLKYVYNIITYTEYITCNNGSYINDT